MVEYLKGYQSFVLNLLVEKVIPETKTPMEGWVEQTASAERSRARNIMCSDGATCLLVIFERNPVGMVCACRRKPSF